MHLNEARASHLYDLLSALILSANQEFGIVPAEELLLPDGSFGLDACREVLDRVWDDPSLFDDLVERNPLGLPPRVLAELTPWEGPDNRAPAAARVRPPRTGVALRWWEQGRGHGGCAGHRRGGPRAAPDGRICHAAAV